MHKCLVKFSKSFRNAPALLVEYKSSDKYVLESSFHYNGDDRYFDKVNCEVTRDDYFKLDEIDSIVKSLPNGKSNGADANLFSVHRWQYHLAVRLI